MLLEIAFFFAYAISRNDVLLNTLCMYCEVSIPMLSNVIWANSGWALDGLLLYYVNGLRTVAPVMVMDCTQSLNIPIGFTV